MLLLTAISFVFSIESLGAWDGGLGIRPAVQLNGRPDPVEIEKMRAGRLFLVSRSRIELVPVIPEPNDDDLAENSPAPQVRIADGAFDELVFGKGLTTEDARSQAAEIVRSKIDAIDKVCDLSDFQIRKLELAGRGDIERLLDDVEVARKRSETYLISDGSFDQIIALASELSKETRPLWDKVHSDIYDSESSLFAKTLRNVLTNEQAAKVGRLRPAQTDHPPLRDSLKAAAGVLQFREYRVHK